MSRSPAASFPYPALLLIGPTGSGKTPLGDALAERGVGGRRCLHFDFGAELRRAAESDRSDVSGADRAFIRRVLEEGALLEPEDFPVAERLLRAFLAADVTGAGPGREWNDPAGKPVPPLLILNGLPRHIDQAKAIRGIVDVRLVLELSCTPGSVLERIRVNAGGDRAGRKDDHEAMVRKKLEIYARRTEPLLEFYREGGVSIMSVPVDATTTPETLRDRVGLAL